MATKSKSNKPVPKTAEDKADMFHPESAPTNKIEPTDKAKRAFHKFCPNCDEQIQVTGGRVAECPVCGNAFPPKDKGDKPATSRKPRQSAQPADVDPFARIQRVINLFQAQGIPASFSYDADGPKWQIGGKNSKLNWVMDYPAGNFAERVAFVDMSGPQPMVTMSLVTAMDLVR